MTKDITPDYLILLRTLQDLGPKDKVGSGIYGNVEPRPTLPKLLFSEREAAESYSYCA